MQSAVVGRGSAGDDLGDVDGVVALDVRVVRPAGDAEPEPRVAPLQDDLLVPPLGGARVASVVVQASGHHSLQHETEGKRN